MWAGPCKLADAYFFASVPVPERMFKGPMAPMSAAVTTKVPWLGTIVVLVGVMVIFAETDAEVGTAGASETIPIALEVMGAECLLQELRAATVATAAMKVRSVFMMLSRFEHANGPKRG